MIKVVVIVLIILILYVILKKYSTNDVITHENIMKENSINCFQGSGEWDGEVCNCKYPNIVTNNSYNGNCDKVVIRNCKTFYDKDGYLFDFKTKDPFIDGICDCGKNYIYDTSAHKCVLRRVSDVKNIMGGEMTCDAGYVFSKVNKICIKSLCFWDILNPLIKINQIPISDYLCKCDVLRGFIPIKISKKIVGCTSAFFSQPLPEMPSYIFSVAQKEEYKPNYFYPQSLAGTRLKRYLENDISGVDDGTKIIQIQAEGYENLLEDIYSQNVKFYTKSLIQLKNPILFEEIAENLLLLKENSEKAVSTYKPLPPLKIKDLTSNDLFSPTKSDEVDGNSRYVNNSIYYSPILSDDSKQLSVNPEGVRAKVYDYLLLYYYPGDNKIIIEPLQKTNN